MQIFCPTCGSMLKTKQQKNKTVQFCSCGYSSDLKGDATLKEKVEHKQEEIEIREGDNEIHPLTDADCSKCGHGKAYFWTKQTRAGDEPETKFYKCEKCKHTWRDYS
jgi:DNA-directed RNA polymerase subunit M